MSALSPRWVWVWPAVIAAAVTVLVVLVLRLVLEDDADEDVEALPRSPATSGSVAVPSSPPTASPTWSPEEARSRLHLQGDGLDMVGFGASQLDVVRTLTDVLGAPDEEGDQPCDGHPEVQSHWLRWADLSVRFDADTFVGYIEGVHFPPGSAAVDLGTRQGLSPGDSLDRARQLYGELPLRHQAPTPGQVAAELFRVADPPGQGPLFGVVEGAGTESQVIAIFAGDLC
jgi:hypothetical protein